MTTRYLKQVILKLKIFARGGCDLPLMLDMQMSGSIDSWAIRFVYAQFKLGAYAIYPIKSLVENIGFGEGASHCLGDDQKWKVALDNEWVPSAYPENIEYNKKIGENWRELFRDLNNLESELNNYPYFIKKLKKIFF